VARRTVEDAERLVVADRARVGSRLDALVADAVAEGVEQRAYGVDEGGEAEVGAAMTVEGREHR
jgi:hypothetical protein